MKKKRPTITARMKVDCLLHRVMLQFGAPLKDFESNDMRPGDPVVFDHIHAVTFGGAHTYQDIRPCLKAANDKKARDETRDHHHIRRLRGEVKGRASAPIQSTQFPEQAREIASSSFGRRR